jgi:hypothetical protein
VNVGGSREMRDMAGTAHGVFGTGDSGTSGNQWVARPFAQGVRFDTTGTGQFGSITLRVGNSGGSGSPGSQKFSVQARVNLGSLTGYQSIYSGGVGGIEFRVDTAGTLTLNVDNTAAVGTSTGTIAAGVDADIGCSYDGNTVRFYINGVDAGSASASQTFALAQQHCLGDSYLLDGAAGDYMRAGGVIYYVYVWNRPRDAAEFSSIAANPWQIFRGRQIVFPPSATAAAVLSAAGATAIASTYATPRVTVTF